MPRTRAGQVLQFAHGVRETLRDAPNYVQSVVRVNLRVIAAASPLSQEGDRPICSGSRVRQEDAKENRGSVSV
jgi:hypothetical protein